MTSAKGTNANDEWYTPTRVVDKVREVLGNIDTDPASSDIANERIRASTIYTRENSGLDHPLNGKVFLNPPYSNKLLSAFLTKAMREYGVNATEMIILTNSGTDTRWNQIIALGLQAYTIGRITFMYPDGRHSLGVSRGQVFTYFGSHPEKFKEVFTRGKFCWVPNDS